MKNVRLISAAVIGLSSFGSSAIAEVSTLKSVTNSPLLVSYLEKLAEFAAGGASLEFFGWTESFPEPSTQCKVLPASAVVREFEKLAKEVLIDFEPVDPNAVKEFSKVISKGSYSYCYHTICQNMSCNHFHSFISLSSKYRIQFELGFED